MSALRILTVSLVLVMTMAIFASAEDTGRIYGRLTTVDGDVFEGLIRWDKNEGGWVDVLDGSKELPRSRFDTKSRRKYRDQESSIKILGLKIGGTHTYWDGDNSAQSGIRFGHIAKLEVVDDDMVLLTLKSGQEIELEHGSTDIGDEIREIVIEDLDEGAIELVWDDLEMIEFVSPRETLKSTYGDRMYGTLTTRRGEEFTGFVCWDVDELFEDDILDGNYKGRKRKIRFGKIASISRYSSSGATVILTNGDEMLLRETNDVDDGNRGITVCDIAFGQVTVKWDEFDKLVFSKAPKPAGYDSFDGGRPIYGTVYTEDGESHTGKIRWDNDEENTWEMLNGDYHDIEFDIEFGLIKKIEKKSYRSSLVTVSDGRTFRLRGSNDVDEDNKGIIIITDAGDEVEVEWEDFARVEFSKK